MIHELGKLKKEDEKLNTGLGHVKLHLIKSNHIKTKYIQTVKYAYIQTNNAPIIRHLLQRLSLGGI